MNWIKKNPAPSVLALVSIISLGLAVMLYSRVTDFPGSFSSANPPANNRVDAANLESVKAVFKSVAEPSKWVPPAKGGRLFVSEKYIEKDGKLLNIDSTDFPLHPPAENQWIIEHKLPITSQSVLADDPDGDGFSNLDEWNGLDARSHLTLPRGAQKLQPVLDSGNAPLRADSTDPNDPKSHPGYETKLRLASVRQVPFRLILKSYDGKAENKKGMTFFVNAVDRGRKTELLKIGDTIPSDPRYKLTDFRSKIEKSADGIETDKSSLIIVNTEYQEELELPLNTVVDSPQSFAVFHYLWVAQGGKPVPDFAVKKNGEFTLQPEPDKKYKLLNFGTDSVDVQTPSGGKITIPVSK